MAKTKLEVRRQREGTRVHKLRSIKAVIKECPDFPELSGATFSGETRDISARGLCLQSEEEMPVGTTLKLEVTMSQFDGIFSLVGDVQWVEPHEYADMFRLGIHLRRRPFGQMSAWRRMLYEQLREGHVLACR